MIVPDDEAAVNIAWLDKIDDDRVVVLPLSPPSQRGVSNARNRPMALRIPTPIVLRGMMLLATAAFFA